MNILMTVILIKTLQFVLFVVFFYKRELSCVTLRSSLHTIPTCALLSVLQCQCSTSNSYKAFLTQLNPEKLGSTNDFPPLNNKN